MTDTKLTSIELTEPVTFKSKFDGEHRSANAALELRNVRTRRATSTNEKFSSTNGSASEYDLHGVSLKVAKGSRTCIVSHLPEEQAKLLAIITGEIPPDGGIAYLEGLDLSAMPTNMLARLIATYAPESHNSLAPQTQKPETGSAFVASNAMNQPVSSIEAGVRCQRIKSIAAKHPSLIVLVEPTARLAPHDERRVIDAIDTACEGITTVVFSHRIKLARRCDRTLVLASGHLMPYHGRGSTATNHERGPADPTTAANLNDHSLLWDVHAPPIAEPKTPAHRHLRLVGVDERKPAKPVNRFDRSQIESEIAPGYVSTRLLSKTTTTMTWLAWSAERSTHAKVKVARDDTGTKLIGSEYETLRSLSHPGIIRAIEADLDAKAPWAAYEHLEGSTLRSAMEDGLEPIDALHIGFQLAELLSYVHEHDYVILDLSTRTVVLSSGAVILADLAHITKVARTIPDRPDWEASPLRPPEQRAGLLADPKMDIFALGMLLHRAVFGSNVDQCRNRYSRATRSGLGSAEHPPNRYPLGMPSLIGSMVADDPCMRLDADGVRRAITRILPRSILRWGTSGTETTPRLRLVADS